jgi:ADP-heptose:LPS heptosyltransferase
MMSEKWLYFFNILVSRWVNALGPGGLQMNSGFASSIRVGGSSSDANNSGVGYSGVPFDAHSSQESNASTLKNSSPDRSNGQGGKSSKLAIKSILVVKWDEIGDMAAAVHVFGMLKSAFPESKVDVLCKPFVASLIAGDPAIDGVITKLKGWRHRYDVVVELRGTWQTLWKSLMLRTMPKYRVDRGWVRFLQRDAQPHEVLTNERIIMPLLTLAGVDSPVLRRQLFPSAAEVAEARKWSAWAMSSDPFFVIPGTGSSSKYSGTSEIQNSEDVCFDFSNREDKAKENSTFPQASASSIENPIGFAILHTGARRELRRWPIERFVELSKWLLTEKKLMPIWVGTMEEEPQLDEAFSKGAVGKKWVAPEGSSLLSFYAFIASAKLYVGNESGPLQLADISGVPLVAIYGPGVPEVFYPMSAQSRVLHEVLDCNPCDQVHCVRPSDRCIDRISVTLVRLAVNGVLV